MQLILKKKETLIRSLCCPSVCQELLSQERLENLIDIELKFKLYFKFSILWFYIYFKKGMAAYIAKTVYLDTMKGIKTHRVLPVDLEL